MKDGYADNTDGADERGFYYLLFRLAEFFLGGGEVSP